MKRKFILICVSILAVLLTGCGDKDYTKDDADKKASNLTKNYSFIDEEILNDRETIWTYHDEKFDFDFYVKEESGQGSFDGMHWDTRSLEDNYDYMLFEKTFFKSDIYKEADSYDYYNQRSTELDYHVDTRKEMLDVAKKLDIEFKKLTKETGRKTYDIKINIFYKDMYNFRFNVGNNKRIEDIDMRLCQIGFSTLDDDILSEYSKKEINYYKKISKSQVHFRRNLIFTENTGMYTLYGTNSVSGKVLYEYLKNKDIDLEENNEEFSYKDLNGDMHTYTYTDDIPIYNLKEQFNLQEVLTY